MSRNVRTLKGTVKTAIALAAFAMVGTMAPTLVFAEETEVVEEATSEVVEEAPAAEEPTPETPAGGPEVSGPEVVCDAEPQGETPAPAPETPAVPETPAPETSAPEATTSEESNLPTVENFRHEYDQGTEDATTSILLMNQVGGQEGAQNTANQIVNSYGNDATNGMIRYLDDTKRDIMNGTYSSNDYTYEDVELVERMLMQAQVNNRNNSNNTPETPVAPETPADPETPVAPETPADPETPVAPETPADPETPVAPETPADPETPVAPETPADPETPVAPETPVTPETPVAPETPTDPEDEGITFKDILDGVNSVCETVGNVADTYDKIKGAFFDEGEEAVKDVVKSVIGSVSAEDVADLAKGLTNIENQYAGNNDPKAKELLDMIKTIKGELNLNGTSSGTQSDDTTPTNTLDNTPASGNVNNKTTFKNEYDAEAEQIINAILSNGKYSEEAVNNYVKNVRETLGEDAINGISLYITHCQMDVAAGYDNSGRSFNDLEYVRKALLTAGMTNNTPNPATDPANPAGQANPEQPEKPKDDKEEKSPIDEIFDTVSNAKDKFDKVKEWYNELKDLINPAEKAEELAKELLPETVSGVKDIAGELMKDIMSDKNLTSEQKKAATEYLNKVLDMTKKIDEYNETKSGKSDTTQSEESTKKVLYSENVVEKKTLNNSESDALKRALEADGWKKENDNVYSYYNSDGTIRQISFSKNYSSKSENVAPPAFYSREKAEKWIKENGIEESNIIQHSIVREETEKVDALGFIKRKKLVHDHYEYLVTGKKTTVTVSFTTTERILTPSANGTIDISSNNTETKTPSNTNNRTWFDIMTGNIPGITK